MKTIKAKIKKVIGKKPPIQLIKKGLKKLNSSELRKRLSTSRKPVFILFDNEKFEISKEDRNQLIHALMKITNLEKSNEDLSTQDVADLLNVSRPFVIKLIDSNKLKSFKVGSHRRVLKSVALEFKNKMRNEQNEALDELAKETQNLGIEFK